ncbi:MAG: NRAMP family divalent metal transporter, partial [Chloroflexota bacterium]
MATRSSRPDIKPWSLGVTVTMKERWKEIGIGAFVATTFVGSGDVSVASTAGGYFGLGYWWVYWVTCAVAWISMDIIARYWLVYRKPGIWMFRDLPYGGVFSVFIALFAVYFGVGNVSSQFGVTSQAIQGIFPFLPWEAAALIVVTLACGLIWIGNYGTLEKIQTAMLIALMASFLLSLIVTGVNWGDAARGLLPSMDPKGLFSFNFQAIAGTNINGAAVLLFSYLLMEKGLWAPKLEDKARILVRARAGNMVAAFSAAIVGFLLLGVINAIAYPQGIVPRNVMDYSMLLEPIAGSWAVYIFSLGLFAVAFSAALGNGMVGAYLLLDYFNVPAEASSRAFKIVYTGNAIIAAGFLLTRIDPIFLKNITSMMNATFFGVIGLVLAYWAGSSKLGYFRNGNNIFLW